MAKSKSTKSKGFDGVLAFQRAYNISDGEMFNVMPNGTREPVDVVRHGIRGTQNTTNATDPRLLQLTETAKLHPHAAAMEVQFSIRFIPLAHSLSACTAKKKEAMRAMRSSINSFLEKAAVQAIDEIALRYARNIANGRWLWRNRVAASRVFIKVSEGEAHIAEFDALDVPTNQFNNYSNTERSIAKLIANGLRGMPNRGLTVTARLDFGIKGATEVFPSQNYIFKPKSLTEEQTKAMVTRPLYKIGGSSIKSAETTTGFDVVGHAALRDQKISNALRTFDTWYDAYEEIGRPIPVEPIGANLEFQEFFREIKNGRDAFTLLGRLNDLDPTDPDGLFTLACIIRGGVFSQKEASSSKGQSSDNTADETTDSATEPA